MDLRGSLTSSNQGPETQTPAKKYGDKTAANSSAKDSKLRRAEKKQDNEPLDNFMRVTTPENISFQYEVVGPFRRLFAYLIDIAISIAGFFVLVLIFWLFTVFLLMPLAALMGLDGVLQELMGMVVAFGLISYFLVYWFYGAYCETFFNGATLGKSLLNLRVITTDGHAVDGVQAVLRNFFRGIDLMPLLPVGMLFEMDEMGGIFLPTCFFGLVVMMLNRRYQRLGDLVANTVVVSETRGQRPNLEMFKDDRVPRLAELIPDSFFVPRSMARAVADYVDNRRTLNYQRASEIASYLAVPLLERFHMAPDTDHDLLLCAMYYKIFVHTDDEDDQVKISDLSGLTPASPVTTAPMINTERNPYL